LTFDPYLGSIKSNDLSSLPQADLTKNDKILYIPLLKLLCLIFDLKVMVSNYSIELLMEIYSMFSVLQNIFSKKNIKIKILVKAKGCTFACKNTR